MKKKSHSEQPQGHTNIRATALERSGLKTTGVCKSVNWYQLFSLDSNVVKSQIKLAERLPNSINEISQEKKKQQQKKRVNQIKLQ